MARVTIQLDFADLTGNATLWPTSQTWARDFTDGLAEVTELRATGVQSWVIQLKINSADVDRASDCDIFDITDSLPVISDDPTGEHLTAAWEVYAQALTYSCPAIANDVVLPGPNHRL